MFLFFFQPSASNLETPEKKPGTGWLRRLGPTKFVSLEKQNGRVQLYLRHYKKSAGKLTLLGQREVTLTQHQCRDLMSCLPKVKTAFLKSIGEADEAEPLFDEDGFMFDDEVVDEEGLTEHIGQNVLVRVQPGKSFVDIRGFHVKRGLPEPVPGLKGITLFKEELLELVLRIEELYSVWGGLATLRPCLESHQNQEGFLQCGHCNPMQDNE